jgi:ABC-2 type transport system ATP-binding protein
MNDKNIIIEAKNLTKKYGSLKVVDSLDLSIAEGEIYGLLGPNGAGKSTVILMLLGLTEPSGGMLKVAGFNPTREPLKVKKITGYLPEKVGFYEDMTAAQNLAYTAELNNMAFKTIPEKVKESLETVGLEKNMHKLVGHFSKGMKQRLGIADVLIKDPKIVIFDELTEGLDPEVANQILETIADLNKKKKITFILSSHQLNLVQKVCHKVGIMSKGKLIGEGKVDELAKTIVGDSKHKIDIEVSGKVENVIDKLKALKSVKSISVEDSLISISSDEDIRQEISRTIANSEDVLLIKMNIKAFSLEDIYLNYFKEV